MLTAEGSAAGAPGGMRAAPLKAILMAGGEGSRLRPLTCACPKPMAPVLDRPILQYALELLKRHGITEAALTLNYLPERITDYFGDGGEMGMRLRYYTEKRPLGTAGSVAQARDYLTETFLVLSGDGLTDLDITDALRAHREKGALATMVLKRVEDSAEYGVVVPDAEGRIRRFVEKPGWGEVFSDLVNTGIYILEPEVLELIPKDKPFDFGRELFPLLSQRALPLYGYEMSGYWCDVGDIPAYLRAQADLLDGRMRGEKLPRPGAVTKMPGARVDPGAVLEGPCYIGSGASVGAGARIGPYTVLGAGSAAEADASVKKSVLWRGARCGAGAQLRGCILQSGARAEKGSSAFEGSALGDFSLLGEGAVLMPGVKIWPRKELGAGEKADTNLVWGAGPLRRMLDGAFLPFGPEDAAKDARALASVLPEGEILIGRDASSVAYAYARAASAGFMAQAAQLVDLGAVSLPQLRDALFAVGAAGALYVSRDGMLPLNARGARLGREEERKLLGAMAREDYAAPFSALTRPPIAMGRQDLEYLGRLVSLSRARFTGGDAPRVALFCQHELVLSLAERAFLRAGCRARAEWEEELMDLGPGEIGVWLTEDGSGAGFSDAEGMLSEAETQQLLAWTALKGGAKTLILPRGATREAERLAEEFGAAAERPRGGEAAFQASLWEADPIQYRLWHDGSFFALCAVARLWEAGLSLQKLRASLRRAERVKLSLPVKPAKKGRLLKELSKALPQADASDGLRFERGGGWAWIDPASSMGKLQVLAEARDAETAREICDFCAREIARALEK